MAYLVDYRRTTPTRLKDQALIFEHRDMTDDYANFVRSVGYGGHTGELETNLCELLNPDYFIAGNSMSRGMTTSRPTRGYWVETS